ncbi:hypothetical protein [Neobacillus dielmonensis]|uniref:hypothetical protein n=1 Tax=Neobacillus dielmonensis TaxID=1347369 RepID=UPI0005A60218|nr:hypothetical protein [Neobacillus dielmonensis]
MIKPQSSKERLLAKLTGIYDQLEELDVVLKTSFSAKRCELDMEEHRKIAESSSKLAILENNNPSCFEGSIIIKPRTASVSQSLKLELGF